jgi:hypothetical protein
MEWTTYETKLPNHKSRREMKRFATEEDETVVTVPEIVRVAVVSVEKAFVVIVFNVEQVEVAIRVSLYKVSSIPPPVE